MATQYWDDGSPRERRAGGRKSYSQQRNQPRTDRGQQRDAALCRQTERLISTDLMLLDGVQEVRVLPAPDSSRLAVWVSVRAASLQQVEAEVLRRAVMLRAEVAHGISRKKAPELSFIFAPAGLVTDGGEVRP